MSTIILKKSSTAGGVPLTSDLEQGEVALNLADRKLYTKDQANNVVAVGSAFVGTVSPTSPIEGDLWYDTNNDLLKAYNGATWLAAGYIYTGGTGVDITGTTISIGQSVGTTDDVTFNNISVTGTVDGRDVAVDGVKLDTIETNADVTDFTNVQAAGALMDSELANIDAVKDLNQGVSTTDSPTFADTTLTGTLKGPSNFVIDPSVHGDDTGTVIIAGNLTVRGLTTSVNSNEVNIGDSVILLNANETGTPTQNSGFEVERGTSANVSFLWDEANGYWTLNGEELSGVVIDGGEY